MRCKDCKHWARGTRHHGICNSGKLVDCSHSSTPWIEDLATDQVGISDAEGYSAQIMTGADFGCIHFEAQDE